MRFRPRTPIIVLWGSDMLRNKQFGTMVLGVLLTLGTLAPARAQDDEQRDEQRAAQLEFFERKIRPVLVGQCIECHGPKKQHNGLRLDSSDGLRQGGDSGPAIDLEHPEESLLIQALRHAGPEMPPDEKLPDAVIADFVRWVASGAIDPREAPPPDRPAAEVAAAHWAFQPVQEVTPPAVENAAWPQTPIDRFLLAKQESAGVRPGEAATRRVLIRRATWDLIGLPPTPNEVEAFVSDSSPDAYAKLIERLLASPHYGERWGRHWLDLVRYADTAGETADFPAPEAWRYRNYVIDAFNKDKPYDEFIREQIAGDILATEADPSRYEELITATGYLAISRRFGFNIDSDHYLTIEDTIDTLGKSVLGLTIACARCHDHKYDPISAADYYGLYGIFASTKYAFPGCENEKKPRDLVSLLPPDETQRRLSAHRAVIEGAETQVKQLEANIEQNRQTLHKLAGRPAEVLLSGEIPNGGQQTLPESSVTWNVAQGELVQLSILPKGNYGADSTVIELEIAEVGGEGRTWNLTADLLATIRETCDPDPWRCFDLHKGPKPFTQCVPNAINTEGLLIWQGEAPLPSLAVNEQEHELSYLTVKLPPRQVSVHPSADGGVAVAWVSPIAGQITVRGRVADADSSGGDGVLWSLERRTGFGDELRQLRQGLIELQKAKQRHAELAAAAPNIPMAYAVREGKGRNVQIHERGDPQKLGEEVPRKFLDLFGGEELPATEQGSGRRQLADWLTDPKNPLTARVIVNRIWLHHFGRGLVSTPNDFGLRGEPPTHPELLDWLAVEFVRSGWSIKQMHRLIMLSSAYQLSAEDTSENRVLDPTNQLYWHFERRRLDAEQIRDGMLAVSGKLDPAPGTSHPFPPISQWGFTQHGPFSAIYETNKRSIYLMVPRIRRHPFLGLFDGADPNASTPVRTSSTVPPQALFFLNDPFVHEQAAALAARLIAESSEPQQRIDMACRLLFARPAEAADYQEAGQFFEVYQVEVTGLAPEQQQQELWQAYARILLSSNEFLYVE